MEGLEEVGGLEGGRGGKRELEGVEGGGGIGGGGWGHPWEKVRCPYGMRSW